jgi:hypothetical protein
MVCGGFLLCLRLFAVVCGVCGCLRLFAVVCGVCGCLRCLCFLGRPVGAVRMSTTPDRIVT